MSLHFYCVLFIPCLGLIELLRIRGTRQFRFSLWIALSLAGGSIFVWLPLMRAISRLNVNDTSGFAYGPRPTFESLISMYSFLFQGWGNLHLFAGLGMNGLIVLCAMCLIGVTRFFLFAFRKPPLSGGARPVGAKTHQSDFWRIVVGVVVFPLIVFLFALAVTKTFNLRYVIAGSLGASALLAEILAGFPEFRRLMPVILLIAAILTAAYGVPAMELFDHSPVYSAFSGFDPIVVADGSQFFQLEESAPVQFRSRLVYLIPPQNVPVGDPTNQHEVMRWKTIVPNLPVENASEFLRTHSRFYVLDERTADDTPATYLLKEQRIDQWRIVNGAVLYRSHPAAPAGSW